MRYGELKSIFIGDLCGDSPSLLVWLFMLGESQDGLIGSHRGAIASMTGLGKDDVDAAISRLLALGWIEPAYEGRPWGWFITDSAPLALHSSRLAFEAWKEVRDFVFARDDYTCIYCSERGGILECDHIVPISRGGTNEPSNLGTACRKCNRSKRAKSVEEFMTHRSQCVQ